MAVLYSPRCLFALSLILNFSLASVLGFSSTSQDGEVSVVKRATPKTFEIPFNITMYNGELYGFDCSVGKPAQKVHVGISVYKSDSQLAYNISNNPWASSYNYSRSSTYKLLDWAEITALSATDLGLYTPDSPNIDLRNMNYVRVFYGADTLGISAANKTDSITINDFPFVTSSNFTLNYNNSPVTETVFDNNAIGLGLLSGQAVVYSPWQDGKGYPTFTQQFVNKSKIESNTYSIWLDDASDATGHLLLGGINTKRYRGSLRNLPTALNYTSDDYGIALQTVLSVGITSFSVNDSPIPKTNISHVVLAHSPITLLPEDALIAVWDTLGATYDLGFGIDQAVPKVPCSYLSNTSTIDFTFSGSNLTVPIPLSAITAKGGQGPLRDQGPGADRCILLIQAVKLGLPAMLGTNIMRSLYTVYDLQNNVVSVALTDLTKRGNNVVAIPTGGVASISKEAFGTDNSDIESSTTGSAPTTSNTSSSSDGNNSGGNGVGNNTAKITAIAAGVAVPIIVVLAIVGAFFFWLKRRSRRNKMEVKEQSSEDTAPDVMHSKAELAHDPKQPTEAMGKPVSEVDGTVVNRVHEMDAKKEAGGGRHELPTTEQRHELA